MEGKFPKSTASKLLKVSTKAIEKCIKTDEAHHSSKMFNLTDVYDIRALFYMKEGMFFALEAYYQSLRVCWDYDDEDIASEKMINERNFKLLFSTDY